MSPLRREERRELLDRARRAIADAARANASRNFTARFDSLNDADVQTTCGVFVTLHARGQLRGCVGQIEGVGTLADVVERCAVAAAMEDPRFAPVAEVELADLEIEISLLSPLEPVSPNAIEIGRHGLVVERGSHRGLLLPQVAAERHWQWQRFVEETCVKADLARDAWKDPATRTFSFTTEVFSEASCR